MGQHGGTPWPCRECLTQTARLTVGQDGAPESHSLPGADTACVSQLGHLAYAPGDQRKAGGGQCPGAVLTSPRELRYLGPRRRGAEPSSLHLLSTYYVPSLVLKQQSGEVRIIITPFLLEKKRAQFWVGHWCVCPVLRGAGSRRNVSLLHCRRILYR